MATELKLPDELEGVEGVTINRWLAKAGEKVKTGDPLLEVATEKVDTQIQSPADGTVLQVNFKEGEIVPAGAVLALIGSPDEAGIQVPARAPEQPEHTEVREAPVTPVEPEAAEEQGDGEPKATPVARRVAAEEGIPLREVKGSGNGGQVTKDDVLAYVAQRKDGLAQPSPAAPALDADLADVARLTVRRLAAEHNIDLREVAKGRPLSALTVYDLLSVVASRAAGKPVTVEPRARPERPSAPAQPQAAPAPRGAPAAVGRAAEKPAAARAEPGAGEEFVPHSRMRTLVARNTVQSAFSIPHVTTMWDVNMTAVIEHRKAHKAEFAASGINLTITAYLVQAAIAGLKAVPAANSVWSDEGVTLKHYFNIGLAVALPADEHGMGGLIVPVIKNAGDLSLMGVARAVNDLAQRARSNALKVDELQGGTFSITNYGTSGSRFQTPVIAGNQAGILGVGAVEKRAVVISSGSPLEANLGDRLAFLPMMTLGFSYDHRILDGATADAFCAAVKDALENWR